MHLVISRAMIKNVRGITTESVMQNRIMTNNSKTRKEESEEQEAKGVRRKQMAIMVEFSSTIETYLKKTKQSSCKTGHKTRPGYRLLIRYFRPVENRIENIYYKDIKS